MNQKQKIGLYVGIALVGVIVLLVITLSIKSKVRAKISKACSDGGGVWDKKNKVCVELPPPPVPVSNPPTGGGSGSGNQNSDYGFNPDYLAKEIFTNIEGINGWFYFPTAEKILALNDVDLRKLYDHYNRNYAKEFPTLTQLFSAEWDGTWFSTSPYDRVVNRLTALGLS